MSAEHIQTKGISVMNFKLSRLGAFVISLGAAQAAMAAVPAGWAGFGDVAIGADQRVVLTTASFAFVDDYGFAAGALNVSGQEPRGAGFDLETVAGVAPGSLDLDAATMATEGSALSRSFKVNTGDRISFDWQLATRDTDAGLDFAFVVIGGQRIDLGKASQAGLTAGTNWLAQTGISHFEYTFQSGGDVAVAFGVVDVGDYSATSALMLDNIAVVPEPASYALLLGGGMLLAAMRRRKG
jgi:PEP-CTERM motif